MVHWFCLLSWRLFDVRTSYFEIMSQYDTTFSLKINVGLCDLYFMVQWFFSFILKTVWCMDIIIWDYESVWPDILPKNKCMSLWPIFHGRVILPYISKTIWWMSVIFSDNEAVWPKLWPQIKRRSTWPIFYVLVILLNITKIIWWMNIIVGIMNQCDTKIDLIKYSYVGQWPIFYGPVILLHILRIIWWRKIVFGVMDQCDTKIDLVKYMWVKYIHISCSIDFALYLIDLN